MENSKTVITILHGNENKEKVLLSYDKISNRIKFDMSALGTYEIPINTLENTINFLKNNN